MLILMTAAAAVLVASMLKGDDTAITCVREPVTGSLVGARKVCRTNREWREIKRSRTERAREQLTPSGTQGSPGGR